MNNNITKITIDVLENINETFKTCDNNVNIILGSDIPLECKSEGLIVGVDEAGRGPVLGPMVYGICYCPISKKQILEDFGCADSKSLTEEKRELIFEKICSNKDTVGWTIEALSPNFICNNMLRRQKVSLNQIAQDSTVGLLKNLINSGVCISEVYIDTVGPPEKYQEKLSSIFPEFKITVAKKADATYPVVSAASICAKVSRDRALQVWNFQEGLELTAKDFGSGYPNDPVTKKFLEENIDPVFGFPKLVRFSWSTASKILEEKAISVEWESDDEDNDSKVPAKNTVITSFFKKQPSAKRESHAFFQERHLATVNSF